jgi:decaprenylphospho-beta-D-erythro-pentofuranosid-2-ulose 2-reductase
MPVGRSVLILGGTSAIGVAIAERLLAEQPGPVVIAARDIERAGSVTERLLRAGATATSVLRFDGRELDRTASVIGEAASLLGRIDIAIVAFGSFADTDHLRGDLDAAIALIELNLSGAIAAGEALETTLRAQGTGTIIAISSRVADHPVPEIRVYAASKAGFDSYFQSLAMGLVGTPVRVLVVRPPGVNTGLIPNDPGFHSPDEVAVEVMAALATDSPVLTIHTWAAQRHAAEAHPQGTAD